MRGRSLLKEPGGSSICAFCAYRLKATRWPSHVQRRFLQSSRPASRPPATAAAVREEDEEYSTRSNQSDLVSTGGSEAGFQTTSFSRGFGRRPAFGNATASTPTSSSSTFSRPIYGRGTIELTEEERAARDLINCRAEREEWQQPRQPVNVFPTPGAQSSRAGRPVPISEAQRLVVAQAAANKQRAIDLERRRKEAQNNSPRISKAHILSDSPPRQFQIRRTNSSYQAHFDENSQFESRASGWTHLRRREDSFANQAPPVTKEQFPKERAEREETAKNARYTPFGNGSILNHSQQEELAKGTQNTASSRRLVFAAGGSDETELKRGAIASTLINQDGTTEKASPTEDTITKTTEWRPMVFGLSGNYQRKAYDPTRDEFRKKFQIPINDLAKSGTVTDNQKDFGGVHIETQHVREEKQGKKGERHAAEEARRTLRVKELPKGRERDKAKRRQQFVQEWDDDAEAAAAKKAEVKRQRKRDKAAKKAAAPIPILLPEYISVANLATALRVRVEDFVGKMEDLGFEETDYDHILNGENAGLIAMEYNFEPIVDQSESEDLKPQPMSEDPSILPSRPPIVTIMGHVDHGKTTLLDYLRNSSVAATEHGGITQHIGAFSVPMPSGKFVTFLDTPGHAAFLSMRQRGANVTDIVVLVVAADDSVKPQTVEAINHAKVAKVPIIVAINKIDKEGANIERVKQDLARHGVEIEDYGGDTQVVCVSGKTGQGINELEEAVVTLSEILDMRSEREGQAEGWILEASVKSLGKVATVLVRRGTLRPGDCIVAGKTWARVRSLRNEAGMEVLEASPGMPVQIDGWKDQPLAGDEVLQAPNESKAKSVIEYRLEKEERNKLAEDMQAINETRRAEQEKREREKEEALLDNLGFEDDVSSAQTEKPKGPKQIYFLIKGDVSGSVEAVVESISSIGNGEVQPHILRSGVGQLAEFDVEHAAAAKGYLVNFNTPVDPNIVRLAEQAKVKIMDHNIIYRLVDDVKATLSEYLAPTVTQRVIGEADVAQVFDITIKGRQHKAIAGCKIRNGMVAKNAKFRVLRDGEKIFDGNLESLKNVKKDVTEMRKGSECGMGFAGWNDFQAGDQVQCYETKEEKRSL